MGEHVTGQSESLEVFLFSVGVISESESEVVEFFLVASGSSERTVSNSGLPFTSNGFNNLSIFAFGDQIIERTSIEQNIGVGVVIEFSSLIGIRFKEFKSQFPSL